MSRAKPARRIILTVIVSLVLGSVAADDSPRPCRTALVLGGGGARGGAHVGVLKVLEELRVPVDCVAGTSMGSLVGGLYSVGYSPEELENILVSIDWENAFRDAPKRSMMSFRRKEDDDLALFPLEFGVGRKGITSRSGVLSGQKIGFLLRQFTVNVGDGDFDDLNLPFRAVAADLDTGDVIVLDHGDLAQAMRASMSIPGVFTPVEIDGRLVIDGGIASNLPVDIARAMGAERVIAIDVGTPPHGARGDMGALAVYNQTFGVLAKRNVREQLERLGPQDLVITPELGDVATGSFAEIGVAIDAGEMAARSVADRLQAFSVSEREFAAYLERQRKAVKQPELIIDAIEIRGAERVDVGLIEKRMVTRPGQPLDMKVLGRDLLRMSQAGEFESVGFSILREERQNRLLVDVKDKSWGPNYLRFGIGLESDFEGSTQFRLLTHLRRPNLNRLNAEWKSFASIGDPLGLYSEFYQPLERTGTWFVAPRMQWLRSTDRTVLPGGDEEEIRTNELQGGLDFGAQFGNYGEIRAGVVRGVLKVDPVTSSAFSSIEPDTGGATISATFDQLDNVFFPTKGVGASLDLLLSREGLGADDHYEKLFARLQGATSIGRNTFVGTLRYGSDLNSDIPAYDEFELGGFLNLSGLRRGELRGDVSGSTALIDYWRLGRLGALGKLYGGGGIEAGNAWQHGDSPGFNDLIYSGLAFFGVDNIFSPVYLGYGHAEGGHGTFYVFVGRPF